MSELKWYIGIDPGKKGGIFALCENGDYEYIRTPLIGGKVMNIKEAMKFILKFKDNGHFALELVSSVKGSSAGSNFSFGRNFGQWEGILEALFVKFTEIRPKEWQKISWEGVPIIKKSGGKENNTKATSKIASQRLFPEEEFLATERSSVAHEGVMDGALIAYALKCKLAGK